MFREENRFGVGDDGLDRSWHVTFAKPPSLGVLVQVIRFDSENITIFTYRVPTFFFRAIGADTFDVSSLIGKVDPVACPFAAVKDFVVFIRREYSITAFLNIGQTDLDARRIGARCFFTPEPGVIGFGAMGFGAAVFIFEFQGNRTEKTGTAFADVSGQKEGADILADTIVDVGVPALGLFL